MLNETFHALRNIKTKIKVQKSTLIIYFVKIVNMALFLLINIKKRKKIKEQYRTKIINIIQ